MLAMRIVALGGKVHQSDVSNRENYHRHDEAPAIWVQAFDELSAELIAAEKGSK